MSYTRPTLDEIYSRVKSDMEARLADGTLISSASLLGILARVIAGAVYLVYGFLAWISSQIFVDTADETGLTRWGAILATPRGAPTYATGTVAFTGTAATTVVSGTAVQNSDGAQYTTEADFIIGTDTEVTVTAVNYGTDGNTTDVELTLVAPLTGVNTEVTVLTGFDNAEDLEDIESWTLRILQRMQSPPSSGTIGDYERWALEADGVAYAKAFGAEDWAGAGTVGLSVSGPAFATLSAGTIAAVKAYVDALRPLGAVLTVYSPVQKTVNLDISITPNTAEYQDNVETAITALYDEEAAPGATMYVSRLYGAIGASGVSNFVVNDIVVDSVSFGAADYTMDLNSVPVLGTITITAV